MELRKTVLIADDDPSIVDALIVRCETLGLETQAAMDGLEVLTSVLADPPDLLILDIEMPAADGLTVLENLLGNETVPPFPVIFLSGKSDPETIARCEALGAHYVIKGAGVWETLQPIICELAHLSPDSSWDPGSPSAQSVNTSPRSLATAPKVLAVDDDPDILKALRLRLGALGIECFGANGATQGYWMALKEIPDVIITDYNMPNGSGRYLLRRMKESQATRDIPIIVLTGASLVNGRADKALQRDLVGKMDAAAYLTKPLNFEELVRHLCEYIELPNRGKAAEPAVTDDSSSEGSWRSKVRAVRTKQAEPEQAPSQ